LVNIHHGRLEKKRLGVIRGLEETRPAVHIEHAGRIAVVQLVGQKVIKKKAQIFGASGESETHRSMMMVPHKDG